MQSKILRISDIDVRNRLTVEHYLSKHLTLIGQIRQGAFPLVELGNLVSVRGGKRLPLGANYSANGVPYVRVVDIGKYEVELQDVVYISEKLHRSVERYQLEVSSR
jgi:hypothetical protein